MSKLNSAFLIDTNSFIAPYKRFYSFDLAPNFWRCIEEKLKDGSIVILDKVYDEVIKGDDELSDWFSNISPLKKIEHKDPNIIKKYKEILIYIQTSNLYTSKALAE